MDRTAVHPDRFGLRRASNRPDPVAGVRPADAVHRLDGLADGLSRSGRGVRRSPTRRHWRTDPPREQVGPDISLRYARRRPAHAQHCCPDTASHPRPGRQAGQTSRYSRAQSVRSDCSFLVSGGASAGRHRLLGLFRLSWMIIRRNRSTRAERAGSRRESNYTSPDKGKVRRSTDELRLAPRPQRCSDAAHSASWTPYFRASSNIGDYWAT